MSKYPVPFIDLPKEYKELDTKMLSKRFKNILLSGRFILGKEVEKFEEAMADYLEVEAVVAVNSGTDALILSLKALGVGPGDEVITVAHTFAATIAAIKHVGATPVLVDTRKYSYNMDTNLVEEAITDKTKVILPVHLNGRCCCMDSIWVIAYSHALYIIEDACQALGSMFKGQKAGSWGLGCFSTHPLKTLSAAGDGGYIAIPSEYRDRIEYLRDLRNHGTWDKVHFDTIGYNSRLDEVQASILNWKLPNLPSFIDRRRKVAMRYQKGLENVKQVKLPYPPELLEPGCWYDTYNGYTVRVPERERLVKHLYQRGIETLVNWPIPLHLQKCFGLEHYKGKLPVTEMLSKEVLNLPIFPQMENKQVDTVIGAIKDFYNG
ncbi:hypothetical protein LCGC14_0738740 [marine sediment metagenome]|uniref:DegT/DnrJ/EryC1/StrS family aminotransferase n=1 Tax=marine sediment metagenome TaxID=412755 RepID=A0A0F9QBL2_9ZZZZ